MEQHQDALSAVVAAFEAWRMNRQSRTTPIPKSLRQQAVELLAGYGYSQITRALRISGSQYSQWLQEAGLNDAATVTHFVALPETAHFRASLHHPSGSRLDLHELNDAQLSHVIRCLLVAA